jgi:formylglycine-generating enzyme
MVLVPAGCFMMGSNNYDDEKPIHQQCFDAPFWINKYEVTNEQFERLNGQAAQSSRWPDVGRPRKQITWFEAQDFCALREAHLPTEREWEYAARGPDNLEYPWGSEWEDGNRVVWEGNANNQTADVGSHPEGLSWVGAQDMAGNVWEWVSSWYKPYPYDAVDGREANVLNDTNVLYRVLRGGSWLNDNPGLFRAATRNLRTPDYGVSDIGFRCVRSS